MNKKQLIFLLLSTFRPTFAVVLVHQQSPLPPVDSSLTKLTAPSLLPPQPPLPPPPPPLPPPYDLTSITSLEIAEPTNTTETTISSTPSSSSPPSSAVPAASSHISSSYTSSSKPASKLAFKPASKPATKPASKPTFKPAPKPTFSPSVTSCPPKHPSTFSAPPPPSTLTTKPKPKPKPKPNTTTATTSFTTSTSPSTNTSTFAPSAPPPPPPLPPSPDPLPPTSSPYCLTTATKHDLFFTHPELPHLTFHIRTPWTVAYPAQLARGVRARRYDTRVNVTALEHTCGWRVLDDVRCAAVARGRVAVRWDEEFDGGGGGGNGGEGMGEGKDREEQGQEGKGEVEGGGEGEGKDGGAQRPGEEEGDEWWQEGGETVTQVAVGALAGTRVEIRRVLERTYPWAEMCLILVLTLWPVYTVVALLAVVVVSSVFFGKKI